VVSPLPDVVSPLRIYACGSAAGKAVDQQCVEQFMCAVQIAGWLRVKGTI
jgi:hypothetical protein